MTEQRPSGHVDDTSDLFDLRLVADMVRTERFVDRPWLTMKIEEELDDPHCRIVLVTGEPGAGKTTLLASLADREPGWPRYFIRRIGESDDDTYRHAGSLASFLTTVGLQLAANRPELFPDLSDILSITAVQKGHRVHQTGQMTAISIDELIVHPFLQLALEVNQQVDVVEGQVTGVKIRRVIHAASQHPQALEDPALFDPARKMATRFPGEMIVVLLDGLDELRFRDAGSDVGKWLTDNSKLPANVRFVVASRHDDPRLDELRLGHEAWVREVRIDPESEQVQDDTVRFAKRIAADVRIAQVLASRGVSADRFVREVVKTASGNFQYLAFMAKTLETAAEDLPSSSNRPDHAIDLEWLDSVQDLPSGLEKLYGLFLIRVRNRVPPGRYDTSTWEGLYRPLLGMLAVARAPLTSVQMGTFGNLPNTDDSCEHALGRLRQFLHRDAIGGYCLYHTSVADFLASATTREKYPSLYCELRTSHSLITGFALERHSKDGSWTAADPYLRMYVAAHAAAVGRLDELVEDPRFLLAAAPTGLSAELGALERAVPVAHLYRQVMSLIRDGDDAGALAHLELYARQAGLDEFADRVAAVESRRLWSCGWTRVRPLAVRQVLGHHDGEVAAVAAVRVDGRPMAVSAGDDDFLRVWDLVAGESAGSLPHGHDTPYGKGVTALATGELGSGEAIVVSGGADGTLRAWNLVTRRAIIPPLAGLESAGQAIAVGAVRGGPLAVCRIGDSVRVWDLVSQLPIGPPILTHSPEVAALSEHAGRTLVAIGENSGPGQALARVWDAVTGEPVGRPLRPEEGWIHAVGLGDIDGAPVVALSDGAYGVQAWDPAAGVPRSRRFIDWEGHFQALAVAAAGHRTVMVVGDGVGYVRLWDLAAQGLVGKPIKAHLSGEITALGLGEVGGHKWLVSAGKERPEVEPPDDASPRGWLPQPVVRVRTSAATLKKRPVFQPVGQPIHPTNEIRSIAISAIHDRPVVVTADIDHRVQLWDPFTAQPLGPPTCGYHDSVRAVAIVSVDGVPIALSATDDTIRVWDLLRAKETLPPLTGSSGIVALGVSRLQGRDVVICATWRDGTRVWDLATGQPTAFQLIKEPTYVHSMAVGDLMGRQVVVFGTRGVELRDLETGELVEPRHPGHYGQIKAVSVAQNSGRTLIVSASHDRTLRAWHPSLPPDPPVHRHAEDPHLIHAADDVGTIAATEVDGRPVAVCSGNSGAVRVVDLMVDTPHAGAVSTTRSAVVGTIGGRPIAICGGADGVQVIDAATGLRVAPAPRVSDELRPVDAVAIGELNGRPVGLLAAGSSVNAWHLATGEPTSMRPIEHETVNCVAVGLLKSRPVVVSGGRDRTVRVSDLETGDTVCGPLTKLGEEVTSVGITTVAGRDVLVYTRFGDVRARYLNTLVEDEEQDRAMAELLDKLSSGGYKPEPDFSTVNETPLPSPRMGERLTRSGDSRGRATALGMVDDIAIVISGHDDGSIDLFTIETALPVGDSLRGHDGPVTAIDYGHIHGRPIIVSGGADGTVRVWDAADRSTILVIRTFAWVWTVALAAPDRCIIATETGLFGVRLIFEEGDAASDALGDERHGIALPVDIRGARACPSHDDHFQLHDVAGQPVLEVCIKGIQLGHPAHHALRYPQGHCYILPDRMIIQSDGPSTEHFEGLVIPLQAIGIERQDTPHAYEYDGCHFGIVMHGQGQYRTLCCYTRADRDQLIHKIRLLKGPPPGGTV